MLERPVNYMHYVTHVFQIVFGWPRKKAEFHMLQVHEQGKSVLTRESMEKAEHYVHQLQNTACTRRWSGTSETDPNSKTRLFFN